jgi:phosphatidylglycerophosphate synthase
VTVPSSTSNIQAAVPAAAAADGDRAHGLRSSFKRRPRPELLCDYLFRPLAHPLVLALARLRVAPSAVVITHFVVGMTAATLLWGGDLVAAAMLLQLKTLLDNADGQLARITGRVTAFGRYLDTEADLIVNAALFASLAHVTGRPVLALIAFAGLTLLLSIDVNLEPLYRTAFGEPTTTTLAPSPGSKRTARALAHVYAAVFAPQDRLVQRFSEGRLQRVLDGVDDPAARNHATRAFHDPLTLTVTANLELTTQLVVLGVCLAIGAPTAYLWFVICGVATMPVLQLRRERRARKALAP